MSDIENIVNKPEYDTEASGASKATIFIFIGTFIACLFFSDNTVGPAPF